MDKSDIQFPITPYEHSDTLLADEFRQDTSYKNWRPTGTRDWLLIFTVAGAGRVGVGTDDEYLLGPGAALLYQPGTTQRYYTDPPTGSWHLLYSHFHPRPHWDVLMRWPQYAPGLRLAVSTDASVTRQIHRSLLETVKFARQRLPGSLDLAMNALERSIILAGLFGESHPMDERVRRAVDWLASHLRDPFSLGVLARHCGLSVSRIAHLFREQVGVSPQKYVDELRLQRAAQLLRSTSLGIAEIAAETGYANAFYFSNRFRKMTGQSPTQYRHRSVR